jgi:hypothetical protein
VRGHPVRYWFKPSGVRNEALTGAFMPWPRCTRDRCRGRFYCAPRRSKRHRGHRRHPMAVVHQRPAFPVTATSASETLRAPAHKIQDEMMTDN